MIDTTEQAFRKIYRDVGAGRLVKPRNQPVIEVEDYSYDLPPYARFANFEARKLKLDYVKKELLWYLRANPFDDSIVDAASIWQELPNRDRSINSNYGAHVFGKVHPAYEPAKSIVPFAIEHEQQFTFDPFNVKYSNESMSSASIAIGEGLGSRSQLEYIVQTLLDDKDSRRASAVILNRKHLLSPKTKDYPCTYALNFRIRDNELKMSVHMRSQDAVFGMGNDAPAFSFIQELVYVLLRDGGYPDLKMGNYHHTCDSFHYYERHFEMVKQINAGSAFTPLEMPKIRDAKEAIYLLSSIHLTYPGGAAAANIFTIDQNRRVLAKLSETLGVTIDISSPAGDLSRWLTQGLT